ncbi:hypothetical protein, partial [Adlercreutzia equolifaciens]|uniref:hypothetical protein n=1 Tax=Adlercreutzia equolifaciens TaxID=446660 RepID=UPI003AF7843E
FRKDQLPLVLSVSPLAILLLARFHFPPDLQNEARYGSDRGGGEKNVLKHRRLSNLSKRRPQLDFASASPLSQTNTRITVSISL